MASVPFPQLHLSPELQALLLGALWHQEERKQLSFVIQIPGSWTTGRREDGGDGLIEHHTISTYEVTLRMSFHCLFLEISELLVRVKVFARGWSYGEE